MRCSHDNDDVALFGHRTATEGVAAVEFGLILPILMLILVGIIEYGYMFYVDLVLTNAAREGARVGITIQDPGLAQSLAESAVAAYLAGGSVGLSVTTAVTVPDPNNNVTVVITLDPFVPLIGYLPSAALPPRLVARSSMRWEWP